MLHAVLKRDRAVRVGPYVVQGQLGMGGMGAVYRAWDPRLERTVALKLLLDRDAEADRLEHEARALAKLEHPNVVTVYDVGLDERGAYVAMALVDGPTLRTWLETHPDASAPTLVRTFAQAGRGLAAAHEVGVVHRDFKPDNAIVGKDGRVQVVDFGIAHIRGNTDVHPTAGTPRFMAPEQRRGEEATARTDQFSFCVALTEALRAQGKLAQLSKETRLALERGAAEDPDARWPSMDALLDTIVPRPRTTRWGLVSAAAVAGVLGLGAFAMRDEAPACPPPRVDAAAVWDAARRDTMRGHFADHDVPGGPVFLQRVDGLATSWNETRTAACSLLHAGDRELEQTGTERLACLDLVAEGLDALVSDLEVRDANALGRAGLALDAIARPSDCTAGRASLVGSLPDATLLREVQAGAVARRLFDYDGARAKLEPAYDKALAADLPRLAATAAIALSHHDNDELDTQRQWAERALESAERANDLDLIVRAWLGLSYVALREVPRGPWEEHLGHAVRLGSSGPLRDATAASLAEAQASQASRNGDMRAALPHYQAAIDANLAAERPGSAAGVRCQRAEAYAALGEMESSLQELDTCLEMFSQHLGPTHPSLLVRLGVGMRLSMVANDLPRVLALADRAIEIGKHGQHRARLRIAPYLYAAGACTERSDFDRALAYLRDGLAVAKTLDSSDAEAGMHGQYGATLSEHGDCAAALPHFDAALDLTKYQADSALTRGITYLNRGECHAKLGNPEAAMADVDRAWEVFDLPETSTLRLAQVRMDGQVSMYAGKLERAAEKLAYVEERAESLEMAPADIAYTFYLRARVEAMRGDHAAAQRYIARTRRTYAGNTDGARTRVDEFERWAAEYQRTRVSPSPP